MTPTPADLPLDELTARCAAAEGSVSSDPLEAARALHTIAAEARASHHQPLAVRAQRSRARALAYAGQYEESLAQARECARNASLAGLVEECARAQLAAMHSLVETGRLDEALAEGTAARDLLASRGLPALRARADINLGIVHQRLDHPLEALECFERARTDITAEPLILGQLENNRGETLLRLYRFDEALQCFQSSLEANMRAEAGLTTAIAEGNIADLEARRGDLSRAIPQFESAIERLKPLGAPGHLLRLRAELAEVLLASGLIDDACREFSQLTRQLDEAGLRREAARARAGHGRSLAQAGEYSQARTMLRAAQSEYEALADATEAARATLELATLALSQGESNEAQQLVDRVVGDLRGRPIDRCRAELILARCDRLAGRNAEALARLDLARAASTGIKPIDAEADLEESYARESRGEWERAIASSTRAAMTLESIRGTLPARRLRIAYRDAGVAHQRRLDLLLDHNGNASEILHSLEAIDARASTDAGGYCEVEGRPDDTLHGRREACVATLNALYSSVADSGPQDPRHGSWRERVAQVEQELDEVEQQLEGRLIGATRSPARESLASLAQNLQPEESVVRFGCHGGELIAVTISRAGELLTREVGSISEVNRLVRALHFHVRRAALESHPSDATEVEAILARLEGQLAPALATVANCGSPVIVPTGALALIPFHAMASIRRSEAFPTIAPSVGALQRTLSIEPTTLPHSVASIGFSDDAIPGAELEAAEVAAIWGDRSRAILGANATASSARDALVTSDLVHIASHGWFAPTSQSASGVRLAERWMNRREIQTLRLHAKTIILSGCETGPGGSGGDATGLFSAFLAAGATGVVASLWTVRDEICRNLMARVHRRWQDGGAGSVRTSLAAEIAALRQEHPHPAHWAPFAFFGSPR